MSEKKKKWQPKIIYKDPKTLNPYQRNAKVHTKKQVEKIANSIDKFGFTQPIVIDSTGVIVLGHGRREAAIMLNMKEVPVFIADHLTDDEITALRIADNRVADAPWDADLLKFELNTLNLHEFDLKVLGFEDDALHTLLTEGEIKPEIFGGDKIATGLEDKIEAAEIAAVKSLDIENEDAVPEVKRFDFVKQGDVWILGNHRLMCGDSTSEKDVTKLMNNDKANMIFTSPPYNANTRFNPGKGVGKNLGPLYQNDSDNKTSEEYIHFTQSVLKNCFNVLDGYIFWNVNYNSNSRSEFIKQIIPYLDSLIETICWKKTALPVPYGLTRTWEPIFIFSSLPKEKRIGHAYKLEFNFWEISNLGSLESTHRAAFPVLLPEKGIELCDPKIVFDPFGGSGTTLIACEKKDRKCFMMELDPHYCAIILRRWAEFTGQDPYRESDGVKLSDVLF